MKCILALIAALFFGQAGAQTRVPIRIFHIFTPNAKVYMNQNGITPAAFITSALNTLNGSFIGSNMQTRAESAGYDFTGNLCCGANAADTGHVYTDPGTKQGSIAWAANSPAVHKAREDAWADIVVVVSDNNVITGTDVSGYTYQRCYPEAGSDTVPRGAQRSIVGVNFRHPAGVNDTYRHEVGHANCAMHDDYSQSGPMHGYAWVTGTSPTDCVINADVMSVPKNITATVTQWTVPEPGLAIPAGIGPTAEWAQFAMAGNCPLVSGYTCFPISCQVVGANATCYHTRKYNNANPQNIAANGSSVTNTFTCPEAKWASTGRFSNPSIVMGGSVTGTAASANNAGVIDLESLKTQTYRDVIISKKLEEAGL